MNMNNSINKEEEIYCHVLNDIILNGVDKEVYGHENLTIKSIVGRSLRFDLSNYQFPILTKRRLFWKGAIEEMLWFIKGTGDVKELHDNGVTIWDDWAIEKYKKDAAFPGHINRGDYNKIFNEDFNLKIPIHYTAATKWKYKTNLICLRDQTEKISIVEKELDQTKWAIEQIKKKPYRKSYYISYWNPEVVYQMADECEKESVVLPACHVGYSLIVNNNRLNLILTMRSWDMALGAPFNIVQYSALLLMYSKCVNIPPGELIINAADCHLYSDQIEPIKKMLNKTSFCYPQIIIKDNNQKYLQDFVIDDFVVDNYEFHPKINIPLTVVGGYEQEDYFT